MVDKLVGRQVESMVNQLVYYLASKLGNSSVEKSVGLMAD